jgi:hypothetical protein
MDIQSFLIQVLQTNTVYSEKIAMLQAAKELVSSEHEVNALNKAIAQYESIIEQDRSRRMVFGQKQ